MADPFRLPVPGLDGRLKDKHLPARLGAAALDALYGGADSGAFTEDPTRPGLFYRSGEAPADGPLAASSPAYKSAARAAGTSRLKVLTIGDSTNDGYGKPGGPDSFTKTWPQLLATKLRTHLSLPAGGRGWVPASPPLAAGNYVYTDVSTLSGGAAIDALNNQIGVPGALWLQPGNGATADTVRWPLRPGTTHVDVVTTGYAGANLLITSARVPANPNPVISADAFRKFTRIDNPGAWVQLKGSDGIACLGIVEYVGDQAAGLTQWNLSQGSMAAHEYAYWMSTPGEFSTPDLVQALNPHVALVNVGSNDYTGGRTAAQLNTALTTLNSRLLERAPAAEVVFIIRPHGDNPTGPTWNTYSQSIVTTAATVGANVLDLRGFTGPGLFIADGVHFTEAGNIAYADAVLDYLKVGS